MIRKLVFLVSVLLTVCASAGVRRDTDWGGPVGGMTLTVSPGEPWHEDFTLSCNSDGTVTLHAANGFPKEGTGEWIQDGRCVYLHFSYVVADVLVVHKMFHIHIDRDGEIDGWDVLADFPIEGSTFIRV